jgi:hypothetical protein
LPVDILRTVNAKTIHVRLDLILDDVGTSPSLTTSLKRVEDFASGASYNRVDALSGYRRRSSDENGAGK